jgi:hypothetical protein
MPNDTPKPAATGTTLLVQSGSPVAEATGGQVDTDALLVAELMALALLLAEEVLLSVARLVIGDPRSIGRESRQQSSIF